MCGGGVILNRRLIPHISFNRRVLPVRWRPPCSVPQPAAQSYRVLHQCARIPITVSQPPPHLLLGNRYREFLSLGYSRIPGLLARSSGRGDCKSSCQSMLAWRFIDDVLLFLQWSKACYSYGMAVCLLQLGTKDDIKEASKLMAKVPGLRQKIAGKSIPVEVSTRCTLLGTYLPLVNPRSPHPSPM